MRVVKCENNHYFDLEKENCCPRCGTYEYEFVGVNYSKADKKGRKKKNKLKRAEKKLRKAEEKLKKTEEKLEKTDEKNEKKEPAPKKENPADTIDLSDEKTVRYEDVETKYAEEPEAVEPVDVEPVEPVVGWLVCVEGMDKGAHFILKAGVNNLGRSVNMDVSIRNDVYVSRDRHSILTYEEESREFFIAPGIGQSITYMNEKPVLSAQKLTEGDCIRMGKTKLIFVPLCSAEFGWR